MRKLQNFSYCIILCWQCHHSLCDIWEVKIRFWDWGQDSWKCLFFFFFSFYFQLKGISSLAFAAYWQVLVLLSSPCFRMKDSTGWHLLWKSQYMDAQVERIALNAKVITSNQDTINNKMVAASSGSTVWLWAVSDDGDKRQIGKICLSGFVYNLFKT